MGSQFGVFKDAASQLRCYSLDKTANKLNREN
jgi:hypothetical protein